MTSTATLFCIPVQIFTEIGELATELLPKVIFKIVGHLEFKTKIIFVIEFQICCCTPNFIKIRWFFIEIYGDLTIFKMTAARPWIFDMSPWPLWPCYSASMYKISLKSDNQLLSYGQKKRFLKWRPSAIFNLKKIHIWLCDCHQVPNVLLCAKFHQNRMIFRMSIWRFSIWRMWAILNFRGPIMGSLQSPCRTFYRRS